MLYLKRTVLYRISAYMAFEKVVFCGRAQIVVCGRVFIVAKILVLSHSQTYLLGRSHLGRRQTRVAVVPEEQLCRQCVEASGLYSAGAEEVDRLEM